MNTVLPPRIARRWVALWLGSLMGMMLGWFLAKPWHPAAPHHALIALAAEPWITAEYPSDILRALKTPAPLPRFTPNLEMPAAYFRLPLNFAERPLKIWFEWQTRGSAVLYWDGNRIDSETGANGYASDLIDLTTIAKPGAHTLAVSVGDDRVPSQASLRGILHIRQLDGSTLRIPTTAKSWEAAAVPFQNKSEGLSWNRSAPLDPLLPRPVPADPSSWQVPAPVTTLPPGMMGNEAYIQNRWRWRGRESGLLRTEFSGAPGDLVYLLLRPTSRVFVIGTDNEPADIPARPDWVAIPIHPDREGRFVWSLALPPAENEAFLDTAVWRRDGRGRMSSINPAATLTTTSGPVRAQDIVTQKFSGIQFGPVALNAPAFDWPRFALCIIAGAASGWLLAGRHWRNTRLQRAAIYGATASLGWLALGIVLQWAFYSSSPASAPLVAGPGWFLLSGALGAGIALGSWRLTALQSPPHKPAPRRLLVGVTLLAVLAIGVTGLVLRWEQAPVASLDQDELSMILTASSIPEMGIPGARLRNGFKALATYELVTYSLAGGVILNGWTEVGARFHSLIYSSLTVLLMGWLGWRFFGPIAGGILLVCSALIPWSIAMGAFAFYPAQAQFFLVLSVICFHEACNPVRVRMRWLAAATLFFILTYLSWEGSGFLIVGLALGMVLIRQGQWRQAFRPGFIAALAVIAAVILLQRAYRILSNEPFLGVGPGLSSINPLGFLKADNALDPLFYVRRLLFLDHHWPFTLLLFASLPLAITHRSYRFLFGILAFMFVAYTFFLTTTALRYGYVMQALLLALAAGGTGLLWRHVCALAEGTPPERTSNRSGWFLVVCFPWLLALLLSINAWAIPSDTILPLDTTPQTDALTDRQETDFRRACHVAGLLKPADEKIIVTFPHAYRFYAGHDPDYALQTTWKGKLILFPDPHTPQMVERFGGIYTITNRYQLARILAASSKPVWLVLTPSSLAISSTQPEVWGLLDSGSEILFESTRALVLRFDPAKVPSHIWTTYQSDLLPIP